MRFCYYVTAALLGATVTCILANEEMHVPEVAALVTAIARPAPPPENAYEVTA